MHRWIIGNWKMNPDAQAAQQLLTEVADQCDTPSATKTVGVCPPAVWLHQARHMLPKHILLGSQDISLHDNGAHTGDLSASMVKSVGASMTLIGHSERRATHGETDDLIARKVQQALTYGLLPIVCVGESFRNREAKRHIKVVIGQLERTLMCLDSTTSGLSRALVAYEPIWAIGTGVVPTATDIAEMHSAIRGALEGQGGVQGVLYGGSVKANNAQQLARIEGVDGFLVGGSSLATQEFMSIAQAYN